jgi:hypothetical protein
MPNAIAKPPEQPEVMFSLEMREKTQGSWRARAGKWISITSWSIDLTALEYQDLTHRIAALRAPEYRPRKARKVANHAA